MAAEVGTAVVSEAASIVAGQCYDSIKREISFVFKYQSYIDVLKNQLKDLEGKRQMVEEPVNHARRQGDEIYETVKNWLKSVDDFTEKVAKPITGGEDEAKKRCFKGLCPNLIKRYSLSKKAVKAAKEGADLLGKGNFTDVSYRPALEKTELVRVRGYEQFDSRLKVFQDVMEVLNDSNVDMIGISGMGGVGKTTLVKQVARKVIQDKLFDEVVMAEVTQTPYNKKIQDKIARDLGLEFGQQESMFERADRLRARLKKEKRVLIILDNIWTKFEFDEVGIPFRDDENQRKNDQERCTIILTSRSRDLLCNDMNSQKNFQIEVLSDEEAEQLFGKIVGDSARQPDFQHIAHEIIGKCEGLPVALNTIANALKNKSPDIWKDALDQLRNSTPREIPGMKANVYSSIELSYNFLESDEAKHLFLLCSLLRACDCTYLLRYGMGLGLFKNVRSLKSARYRVHKLIDNLKASCLLLDGDAEDEIKMHDIIFAVAVSIAEEKLMFNIQSDADFKEERINKDSTAISVSYNIQELPEERLEFPQLKFLLLRAEYDSSLQIPDFLFEGMKQLKVLDCTTFCFPSLPSSLGCLINLQTLCLEDCQLQDIAMVGQLKKLEILSFRCSYIVQLPIEIGQLRHLQLLDLTHCTSLEVIPPNVISKLSGLEELYMVNSFTKWEKEGGGGNASLVELKGLSNLTTLDINIPSAEIIPQDLVSLVLERFWISVGNGGEYWHETDEISRFMILVGLKKITLLGMKMLVKGTESLFLKELEGLQNIIDELDDKEGFPRLKHLQIEACYEISQIVSLVGQIPYKVFPLLESLSLDNLINLEKVCQGQLTGNQSFSNLMIIKVTKCDRLKHLFSFSVAKNLLRLQKIEVGDCCNLEMIVGPDMEKSTTTLGYKSEDDSVIFPCLEELELFSLTSIENICHNQFQFQYQNLKKVKLRNCKGLKYIFSYSMVSSLVQLEHLEIDRCESMEAIVVDTTSTSLGRDEGKLIRMVFPKLNYLRLRGLPKLISFAIGMTILSVEFRFLPKLEITDCPNLIRFIFMNSSDVNILTETQPRHFFDEKIEVGDCSNLEMIVGPDIEKSTSTLGYKKVTSEDDSQLKVIFPSLEKLKLHSLTSIENIWHNQFQYQNLKKVTLRDCKDLKYIFSYSMVNSLVQLEHLDILNCESLEVVVIDTISTGLGGRDEGKLIEMVFPKLNYLSLLGLPKLTSFAGMAIHSVEFPSLSELEIRACPTFVRFISMSSLDDNILTETQPYYFFDEKVGLPNLEILRLWWMKNLRQIWHHQLASDSLRKLKKLDIGYCEELISIFPPMVALPNLMTLHVHWCNGLRSLMTLLMAQSMVKLTSMEITYCEKMEEIIQQELGEEVKDDRIVFSQLKYLQLGNLPSLESFCLGNYTLEFSSLEQVHVSKCRNMKTFSQGVLLTPKLHKVNLGFYTGNEEGYWEGNLKSTIQKMFKEMIGYRNTWNLRLSLHPRLKEIWHSQELPVSFFNELRYLEVDSCTDMLSAIPMNLLRCLNNLRRLAVSNCDSLEVVLHLKEQNIDGHFGPLLPKLEDLKLINLPKLQRFCNFTGNIIALPSLTWMTIENCPKMEAFVSNSTSVHMTANKEHQEMTLEENFLIDDIQPFFNENVAIPRLKWLELSTMPKLFCLRKERLECIKLAQSWVSFQNLTTLEVSGSEDLMTLSTAESVVKLTIREMTQQVGEEVKRDVGLVFVHLKYLKLHHLPSLASFCVGNYILEFPSLLQVIFS